MTDLDIDMDSLSEILSIIDSTTLDLSDRITPLLSELKDLPTDQGVSLIQVKLHSLLGYLQHLAYLILLKINGSEIDEELINSLIEHRLVLEKIKPMEVKIKYQIDKLMKSAALNADLQSIQEVEEVDAEVDPLLFKPNPSSLQSQSVQETENVYRPPRVAPMPYLETRSKFDKKKTLKSRILTDLKDQFDDRPEEFSAAGTGYGNRDSNSTKEDQTWNEREAFEEENFMRLNMTREDKKLSKKLSRSGGLMRFHNEFQNLEKDFKRVSDLNRYIGSQDDLAFGKSGVLKKRNQTRHELKSSGLHNISGVSKRRASNLNDAVGSFAESQSSALGADTMFFKDYKQLGYFDELRKDVLENWIKSERGQALEEKIKEIIAKHAKDVARFQYSTATVQVEEEKARLTSLIRDNINESGVLKYLPTDLKEFVNLPEWKERISKDLEYMKIVIDNQKNLTKCSDNQDVEMENVENDEENEHSSMNQIEFYFDPLQDPFNAIPISYIEPFTRESIYELIKAHYVKGKILILARVEAIDPLYDDNPSDDRSEVGVFYYSAHYLNRLIFRKHGPLNNCYTFRLHCLNPMTNTPITNISYFAVELGNACFDDLNEIVDSPLLSNMPLKSDLLDQFVAKVDKMCSIEKYSVPINSDSFSELPTPIDSKMEILSENTTQNSSISKLDVKPTKRNSKVAKSEACLNKNIKKDVFLSANFQKSLPPKTLSSNQLSVFKNMLVHSADGLSLLSILPSHSKSKSKHQMISPDSIPYLSRDCSFSKNMDEISNTALFGADESALILSSGSIFSQQSFLNTGNKALTLANKQIPQTDSQLSIEVNHSDKACTTNSQDADESIENEKYSRKPSQLKPRLDSVTEETNPRIAIIEKELKDLEFDGKSYQYGPESQDFFESSASINQSQYTHRLSSTMSDSFSSSLSSNTPYLRFKALFIGTDDDFLQSPIIRLLFQANSLNGESTELLPFPQSYIDQDDF